ncbi:MAG TPA: UDP-N-acetylmuramoyl-L-alanyl-D-glutamate--2,6-diaminopimelate ligase [Bacteroidales bacterium]|nr:UDP-N-acetylmuramoyl-L-alanyl-D-glutamate--2,6-diaminopimelate ligase [Bacteroidales bacterium]
MQLSRLIEVLETGKVTGSQAREIAFICQDSRKVLEGCLFVAVLGTQTDGHLFISQAARQGAAAVVYQKGCLADEQALTEFSDGTTFIGVPDSNRALALLADAWYGHPSAKMVLVGVTGTNGKTTTATLLYRMFSQLGHKCGLISTIAYYIDRDQVPATHTTPDALAINSLLDKMLHTGCTHCFMEVSSHSVVQERITGLRFAGGIFTNLTHDHLDYHKTFAAYRDAKKHFFDMLPAGAFALTNLDDRNGPVMVQNCAARSYTYACRTMADFNARVLEHSVDGMQLSIDGIEVWTSFIGLHNAYNLLAVYACAMILQQSGEETLRILSGLGTVSGRMEYIRGGDNLTAVVDYSHTPDALKNALLTLKELIRPGQELICVVGCGGNRDTTKRPLMARIADQYADLCIFTSDNPRFEDPEAILDQMMAGLSPEQQNRHLRITDRRQAIKTALKMARPGAIILVAGKGHETYQDVRGVKNHFDDKEILTEILKTG